MLFGKVGYIAKGIAVGLVGGLFVYAAFTQDPKKSGSTDKALHKVLEQPFGPWLLIALVARDRLLRPLPVRPGPAPLEVVARRPGP